MRTHGGWMAQALVGSLDELYLANSPLPNKIMEFTKPL